MSLTAFVYGVRAARQYSELMITQGVTREVAQNSRTVAYEASDAPFVLTTQDRARIARRTRVGLMLALVAQAGTGTLVALIAWVVAGMDAGASALIGAAAYFVPNALFALRLFAGQLRPGRAGSRAFFWGEALKLLSAAMVLALVAWYWGSWLVWPAFLLGLLGATKGYVVLMALRRLP